MSDPSPRRNEWVGRFTKRNVIVPRQSKRYPESRYDEIYVPPTGRSCLSS